MKITSTIRVALITFSFFVAPAFIFAQGSVDSRICNCFAAPVADNFMQGVKAVYGKIGLYLSPNLEIPSQQLQPVKFTIPVIQSKQGCQSWYSIYITDGQNNKVYESAGRNNEITYAFPDCDKTYAVVLMAYSKSANGGDGNCTRRITFTVKPTCNTASCDCGITGKSAAFALSGEVQCKGRTGDENRYLLRYSVTNKSSCILTIQSITMMNQVIEASPSKVTAKSSLNGISLGFATPSKVPIYSDSKVSAVVRYSLNGRKCSETVELPYRGCN
ncbi:MAG: hypothetical protein K9J37_04405 [Saprospiraceae bacterium]|nr:hypothetical protein [Saprospiraceae bacterium]MCF8249127.1 hypothetical protein [Saprospiraceae bacterium]MCF8281384.1 hypothetical protein [Bacteroidales bacterium]MCF8311149.1 hypothetical protein [Saprospiraceae bacterium]MCF8440239.1 hypothetical protein [Saprospiraceae bacterium]